MADINKIENTWERLGEYNAFWAVLSDKKKWNQKDFFATGTKEIRWILGILKTHSASPRFGQALDFGCGVGRLSQALGKHFKKVLGVDIADSMIGHANKLNKLKNVSFKLLKTGDLSIFKEESFDFIFSDIVLQHMNNELARGYLKEFCRVLKRQGVLVFQLPSQPALTWKGLMIMGLPDPILTRLRRGMEMNPIRKKEVLKQLSDLGFEVITVEHDTNHKHWRAYFYFVRKP